MNTLSTSIVLSEETRKLWTHAIDSVAAAQERFVKAYRATLDEVFPHWQMTWKTDGAFDMKLGDVEQFLKKLCVDRGMKATTFAKYRKGARAVVFGNMNFKLGANFSIKELQQIRKKITTPKRIRLKRRIRESQTVVAKVATILPFPTTEESPDEYVATVIRRMAEYLSEAKDRLDNNAYTLLVRQMRQCLDQPGSTKERRTATSALARLQ